MPMTPAPFNPANITPGFQNLAPGNARKWAVARGRVIGGKGNAAINLIGDSTNGLVGTGTGGQSVTGGQPFSMAASLARLLNGLAGRADAARNDSFWGTGFSSASSLPNLTGYDARIAIPADWTQSSVALAGATIAAPAGITSALTFQPMLPYDRVDLYYWYVANGATITVASASGGSGTVSTNKGSASAQIRKSIVSLTRGTGQLSIAPATSTGGFFLVGVELWDSSVPQFLLRQIAQSGSTTAKWTDTSTYYAAGNSLAAVVADMTILGLGLNDSTSATDAAVFAANVQSIATSVKAAGGDFALFVANESSAGWNGQLDLQRGYAVALKALAAANGFPLIDLPARWGDYATASANGLHANDPHPNALGYADKALAILDVLRR